MCKSFSNHSNEQLVNVVDNSNNWVVIKSVIDNKILSSLIDLLQSVRKIC